MISKIVYVLLDPRGRIRRGQFWLAVILVLLLGLGVRQAQQQLGALLGLVIWIYLSVCIYGKRLHDLGRSAWILLVPFALTFLVQVGTTWATYNMLSGGMGRVDFSALQTISFISASVPAAVWILTSLIIGVPVGQLGDNRFGRDPRETKVITATPGAMR